MTPKSFLTLAAVTAATLAAATWSVTASGPAAPPAREGERFLPDLAAEANETARITVTEKGASYTVARTPEGWVLPDKGGFPARIEAMREVIGGLARMTVIEAKTNRPDRLKRLDLQDPADPEAPSRQVRLEEADGTVLADLVLGRADYALGSEGGLYIREAGSDQAWLVQGRVPLPSGVLAWADRQIADVPVAQVASLSLGGGESALTVIREPDGKARLADGKPANADEAKRVFGLFEGLRFDDVRAAEGLPEERALRAELVGTDGLRLRLSTVEGEDWALIEAEATGDDAREAADAIARRVDGFAFKLPESRLALLETTADTLTAPSS